MKLFIAIAGILSSILFNNGGILFCSLVCFGESLKTEILVWTNFITFNKRTICSINYYNKLYIEKFINLLSIFLFVLLFIFTPYYFQYTNGFFVYQALFLFVMMIVYRNDKLCLGTIIFALLSCINFLYTFTSIIFLFLIVFMMWRYLTSFIDSTFKINETSIPPEFIEELEFKLLSLPFIEDIHNVELVAGELIVNISFYEKNIAANMEVKKIVLQLASDYNLDLQSINLC